MTAYASSDLLELLLLPKQVSYSHPRTPYLQVTLQVSLHPGFLSYTQPVP
jgi:hypothetical protein